MVWTETGTKNLTEISSRLLHDNYPLNFQDHPLIDCNSCSSSFLGSVSALFEVFILHLVNTAQYKYADAQKDWIAFAASQRQTILSAWLAQVNEKPPRVWEIDWFSLIAPGWTSVRSPVARRVIKCCTMDGFELLFYYIFQIRVISWSWLISSI